MRPPLLEIAGDGYPIDYLLARIRGRRAALARQWQVLRTQTQPQATSDEAIWDSLLHEFAWLRTQMNGQLRECFANVFLLFESKTVVLCLRNRVAERGSEVDRLLASSQLGMALQQALRHESTVAAAVAAVAEAWAESEGEAALLQRAYAEAGIQGFEHRLVRSHLEHVGRARVHPAVRSFFAAYIDLRNLMTLYKHLRWSTGDAGDFTPGGRVDCAELRAASVGRNSAQLDELVRRVAGRAAPPVSIGETALETILLGSLTAEIRSIARVHEEIGTILDYLWRLYVHARNRALLFHAGGELTAAMLERELIA